MSNQINKYKRFFATSVSTALVATASFPLISVASTFPDVDLANPHAENINELVQTGIIKGYEDGTFKPNATLTRGHVVKMLGKWIEDQGFNIPEDYNTVQRFNDIDIKAGDQELVKYATLVKDTGVFFGTNGSLNVADSITRENMALTLDRAYKVVNHKSLVELATDSQNISVADLATAKEEARPQIQALRNLGITNVEHFQPKKTVTRAQFASFLNRTINVSTNSTENGTVTTTPLVEINSLQVTGVNQFTVTFNHAVTSSDVASFTVTRDTTAITISKVEWNKEKTQAILKVDHKIADGTYDVSVRGIAEKTLTASVKTSREKVSSIQFLSDKLVFTGREEIKPDNKTYKEAIITFAIYNQYGEVITNQVSESYIKDLDVKGIDVYGDENDIEINDGKFLVWVDEDEDDDAIGTVELTYEQNDDEIFIKQDVQLADESEPAQVEIIGIYNPSDKPLSFTSLEDEEEYSILFKVKDQYGIDIDPEFVDKTSKKLSSRDSTILERVRKGIRVSVSNDDIFDVEDEEGNGTVFAKNGIQVINVNGQHYFAIDIFAKKPKEVKGGENTVTFRAKATGEATSQSFTVADNEQPYRIELGLPDDIMAGDEEVKIPVSAYNRAGELLKNGKVMNESLRNESITIDWDSGLTKLSGKATTVFTFIEEKGQIYLKFETGDNFEDKAEDYDIEIEVAQSGIKHTQTVLIEPNAYPVSIASLKNINLASVLLNDENDVELKNFVIEDQYGRPFTRKSVGTSEAPGGKNGHEFYELNLTSLNENVFDVTPSGSKFKVKSLKKGTGTIEVSLISYDLKGDKLEDDLDVTFRTIEIKDLDSFKVKSDKFLYGGNEFVDKAGIKVFGVLGSKEYELLNNGKVYSISTVDKYINTDGKDVTANSSAILADDLLEKETDRYEAEIVVTINDTGDQIQHKIPLAREKALATTFQINESNVVGTKKLDKIDIQFDEVSEDDLLTVDEIFKELTDVGSFEIKEQYNNKSKSLNTTTGEVIFPDGTQELIRLLVTDIDSNKNSIVSSNGQSDLTIKLGDNGLSVGDTFTLTLSIDGKSQKVKVYIK